MEIQDAENAVREIGTAAMDAVQGLDSATIEGSLPFIAGVTDSGKIFIAAV